jgi:hypothetical protein
MFGYVIATALPNYTQINDIEFPNVEKDRSDQIYAQNSRDEIQNLLDQKFSSIRGANKINPYSFYISKVNSLETMTLNRKNDLKIEEHIVICGIISDMKLLILPLRNKNLKRIIPIVIIHPEIIPVKVWQDINIFPKLYVVQGNPTNANDLNACYITKASACIILNTTHKTQTKARCGMTRTPSTSTTRSSTSTQPSNSLLRSSHTIP